MEKNKGKLKPITTTKCCMKGCSNEAHGGLVVKGNTFPICDDCFDELEATINGRPVPTKN